MSPDAYRKKVAREVQKAAERADAGRRRFRQGKSSTERIRGLAAVGQLQEQADLEVALAVALDIDEPASLRAAAIHHAVMDRRNSSRIIAAILEAPQRIHQALRHRLRSDDPHNTAHTALHLASDMKASPNHSCDFLNCRHGHFRFLTVTSIREF